MTNNLKIRTSMNAKISVFVVCAKAILYLLWYNLHDCTFLFTRGRFHPSLFPTKKILPQKSPAWCAVCCMASFFYVFFTSTCIRAARLWPMCGVCGTFSSVGFFRKCILSPFTISKVSRSFERIIHTFKNVLIFLLCLQKTRYAPMDEHFSDRLKEF